MGEPCRFFLWVFEAVLENSFRDFRLDIFDLFMVLLRQVDRQ